MFKCLICRCLVGWGLFYLLLWVFVKGCWILFCFLMMWLLDVILNCFLFGILLRFVWVFSLMRWFVCDLLDLRYIFLYFLVFWSLCFFWSIVFFFFNDENEILIRFGFLNLLLSWEVVVMLILLFRLFMRLCVMLSILLWVLVIFDVMMVRLGLLRGLFIFWGEGFEYCWFLILFKWWIIELIDWDNWFIFFLCIVNLRFILFCMVLNFLLMFDINLFLNLFNLFFSVDLSDCWLVWRFCIVLVMIVNLLIIFGFLFEFFCGDFVIFVDFWIGLGVLLLDDKWCLLLEFVFIFLCYIM